MALLFMDGFSGGDLATKWEGVNGNISRQNSSPRFAGGAYIHSTSGSNITKRFTATVEIYAGFAFSSSNDVTINFLGDANTTTHISYKYSATSKVFTVYRGTTGGTLLATGTTVIPTSTWHYAEMHIKISDTVGVAELRIDGSTTADISFSGDTKNAGTNISVDTFVISWGIAIADVTDVYLCDTTGSNNNSWLGDVTVRTLAPNGNGAFSQFVGSDSDSVNNYLLVNEQPVSNTQYAGSATTGQHDSYTMADLPAGVTSIKAVQLNTYMAKTDAPLTVGKPLLRTASTNYYGTSRNVGATYQTYTDVFETNPNTSITWTATDVNGLEAGTEVG